ncbi:hypothetical protein HN51_069177 [Arachis hypogaea]|uniref:Phytosulfokine n=1 Tax=Arachis hypogaea TaxID=3818 RepID=A0A444Z7C9_ARAHY|nr:phytosulfokines-like [Arachis ipaensis]QHO11390.1 Phytosulfokines [Arachis hypogaea]RYR10069.1 hypothetical protein Ahy_B05g078535 [Arachis hypogaea]
MKKKSVSTAAVFFSFLLTLAYAGRPAPATAPGSASCFDVSSNIQNEVLEEKDTCEGMGKEECLMRRTLAAHIDYIYTQKKQKP